MEHGSSRKSSVVRPFSLQLSASLVEDLYAPIAMPHPMSSSSSSQEQEESPPSPVDESAPRARSPEENAGPGFCPMCATRRSFGDVSHESPSTSEEKSPPWTLVLRFKAISVTMDHTEVGPGYDTFGKKLLGCLLGVCIKLARSKKKSSKIKVLKDVSGYVMPGSMTLVLGPPGSGKSTLLKVMGGKLRPNRRLRLEGVVLYNNDPLSPRLAIKRPIAYVTQHDNVHLPFFTVRETIEFVQRCALWQRCMPQSDAVQGRDSYVDYILDMFGLKKIENERVGTLADGIKDSDRNRLATAEIAMGTYSVLLYDQTSSGQDSLITYDLLQMLQSVVHVQHCAAVISLVQISPESFDLFDRVILLSEGEVLYQGPRECVESYFLKLGFKKPAHVDSGTFLQDIAAGEGGQYSQQPSSLSIEELIKFYKGSDYYKDVLRLVSSEKATQATLFRTSSIRASLQGNDVLVTEAPSVESCACVRVGDKVTGVCVRSEEFQYVESSDSASKVSNMLKAAYSSILLQLERNLDEGGNAMYYQRHFGWQQFCSWWLSTWCLIRRQTIFVMRLKGLAIVRLLQILLVGLFTGSLFYHKGGRLDQYEMNSMRTIGFISMMTLMLINIVQLPVHIVFHRPVFYKQQGQHLFPVSSYVVAHAILNIPQSVTEALLYSLCVYFLASLSKEKAAHYVQYLGLIFVTAYLGSLWMLLVGAIAPMLEVATTMGGSFVALNLLFSGSTIIPSVINWYWRWVLYITPTRWGNVIFTSTQTDNRYELPCTLYRTYPFCLLHPTLSLGQAFLTYYELEAGGKRLVLAFGVIVAYILVLIYLAYLAYSKVRIQETASAIPRQKQYVRGPNNVEQAENGGTRAPGRWTCKLSVKPVTLSFHQLRFTRRDARSSFEQVVLDNVSGYAKPGTMLAIAGGTRSGKATLLNCIAGRLPPGKLEGDVSLNGLKLDRLAICRISGFAEKLEAHQQYLTVRESLEFSANLRLGKQISADDKARHVTEVLELLGLSAMSNQLVGNLKLVTARIQETRRKLTIAVELAVNPGILFLEDPTAQLDGTSSREILRLLQSVALSGRTIISMLDHPSGEALSVFNDVLVLAIGGHTAYFGPVGWNCKQVLHYFTSVPSSPPYNEQWNPVTYILEALGGGIKERKPLHDFSQLYQSSPLHQANAEVLERLLKQQPDPELKNISCRYAASFKTQAAMVFLRNQRFLWRNVTYTLRRLLGTILVALVMGTLYLNISVEKLLSMTSASLFPYIQLIMISGLTANNVIPQLGTDRLVYYRENRARMYSPMLYPLSWAIAEVPYLLLGTLAFVGIGNGLANVAVDSVSAFVQYWIGLFLFTLAVTYFGIFVTLLFPNSLLAMTVSSISTSVWVASSGVSIPRYNVQFYKWLYWINPYQYAVNILTTTAFHCDTGTPACNACTIGASCPGCKCKRLVDLEKKLVQVYGPVFSQFIRASFVWERLSKARVLEKHRIGKDFLALAVMVLLFAVLAIGSFARLKHNRK